MAMHSIFSLVVLFLLSTAFVMMGVAIAIRPAVYLGWVRSSKSEKSLSWVPWLGHQPQYDGWRFRVIGIALALFGFTTAVLTVWICCFQ